MSRMFRTLVTTRIARSEWPPNSKKLSSMPTRSRERRSAKLSERISSCGVLGAPDFTRTRRRGKGAAIDFAVGGQGQLVEDDESGRHHVVGQLPLSKAAQYCRFAVLRDNVGRKPAFPRLVLPREDDRILQAGMLLQDGLDFPGFDAEAADFDLTIGASNEFDVAVRKKFDNVSGSIEAVAPTAEKGRARTSPASTRAG